MQVFEDDDQRLVETFAQDDALDRIERATLAGSRFNLRNLTVLVTEAKQPVKVWQCVFERPIENRDLASHLLAPRALIIIDGDPEIVPEQVDHWQEGGRFPERNRERFQHYPARLRSYGSASGTRAISNGSSRTTRLFTTNIGVTPDWRE
jgi:hypothetical protein